MLPADESSSLPEWVEYFPHPDEVTRLYAEVFFPSEAALIEEVTAATIHWQRLAQQEECRGDLVALVASLGQYQRKVLSLFGKAGEQDETVVGHRSATLAVLESLAATSRSTTSTTDTIAHQALLESGAKARFADLQACLVEFADAVTTWRNREEEIEVLWKDLYGSEDADHSEDTEA